MTAEKQYGDSAPEINTKHLTFQYQSLRKSLEDDGWRTPQTYCNRFDEAGNFSAVYLFMLVDQWSFDWARPAYVGMSKNLAQRWCGHSVLRELEASNLWVQRWFLRVHKDDLRNTERALIERFDPPWNIVGRRRGVPFK